MSSADLLFLKGDLLHAHFGEVLEELLDLFEPFCQMIEETIDFEYLSKHEVYIFPLSFSLFLSKSPFNSHYSPPPPTVHGQALF